MPVESEWDSEGTASVGDQRGGGCTFADWIIESTSICVYIMFTVLAFRIFQSVMEIEAGCDGVT